MVTKVTIKILRDPCRELPAGLIHEQTYEISDGQYQNMRSAVSELEVELIGMQTWEVEPWKKRE